MEAKNAKPAQTAGEAAGQHFTKKKLSSKINYDALNSLFDDEVPSPKKKRIDDDDGVGDGNGDGDGDDEGNEEEEEDVNDEWNYQQEGGYGYDYDGNEYDEQVEEY